MTTLASIAALLDEIENELHRIGYWMEDPPDLLAEFDSGALVHPSDAPSFALWLQCVFLPRAGAAVVSDRFPADSNVGALAALHYDGSEPVAEALDLVDMLLEFDEKVNAYTGSGGA